MTSKNLFFDLIREDLKRRPWVAAASILLFFFLMPVSVMMSAGRQLDPSGFDYEDAALGARMLAEAKLRFANSFSQGYGISGEIPVFALLLMSVICAVSGFSWLHSRQQVDFYHALPVRRETLFAACTLNGVLLTAVPYLFNLVLAGIIVTMKTGHSFFWGTVLYGTLLHMIFFLLSYLTAIGAVLLTGNLFIALAGIGVFYGWGPFMMAVLRWLCQSYYRSICIDAYPWLNDVRYLSPAAMHIYAAGDAHPGRLALLALGCSAVLVFLLIRLYRARRSEAAGHAMAFRISEPIIYFLVVIPSALFAGLTFREMGSTEGWMIFGMIFGLLIVSCVMQVIYRFDFKKLFDKKLWLAVSAGVLAFAWIFFRYDLQGFDRYLPEASQLESAGLYCDRMDPEAQYNYHPGEPMIRRNRNGKIEYVDFSNSPVSHSDIAGTMRMTDTAPALQAAARGVEDTLRMRENILAAQRSDLRGPQDGPRDSYGQITLAYHLKNGRTVYRAYTTNLSASRDALCAVHDMPEYKAAIYPVLSQKAEELAGVNYKTSAGMRRLTSDPVETAQLLAAYQEDLMGLTAQTRMQESPVAGLQFKTLEFQQTVDEARAAMAWMNGYNDIMVYPVYPSFTRTIALLEQEHRTDVYASRDPEAIKSVTVTFTGSFRDPEAAAEATAEYNVTMRDGILNGTKTYTDPARIKEILADAISQNLSFDNSFQKRCNDFYIEVQIPKKSFTEEELSDYSAQYGISPEKLPQAGIVDSYVYVFPADGIPGFVLEDLSIDPRMLENSSSGLFME